MFKKFALSFLIVFYLFFEVAAVPVGAQTTPPPPTATGVGSWYSQTFPQWATKVYGGNPTEIFGERYTAAQVQWVFYGVLAMFLNWINPNFAGCVGSDILSTQCVSVISSILLPFTGGTGIPITQGGVSNGSKGLFANIFEDRPLSGITYLKNIGRRFNLIPEAKAQTGFGFQALGLVKAIQDAWKKMRDVSYSLFVFIVLVFAFMIMFRVKISPQVIISVQSALPKLAVTLILVTFSYAIAGFLVDIMYVFIGILVLVFAQLHVFNFLGVGLGLVSQVSQVNFGLFINGPFGLGIFGFWLSYLILFIVAWVLVMVMGFLGGLVCAGGGGLLAGIGIPSFTLIVGILALVVIIIVGLINSFKIVWMLAKSFAVFILLVIFAPLQLTFGALIPGFGFSAWLRAVASKLAVFPVTGAMFVLTFWFLELSYESLASLLQKCNVAGPLLSVITGGLGIAAASAGEYPPGWPPLLGGSSQMVALLFLLASLAVFIMIPKAGAMVEGLFAGKFTFGNALQEGVVGPIVTGVNIAGLATKAGQAWTTRFGVKTAPTATQSPGSTVGQAPPVPPTE